MRIPFALTAIVVCGCVSASSATDSDEPEHARDSRFADSKRPGCIAGPYRDTQAFIDDYQRYRARTIIAFRELPSYQKQRRERAPRRPAASDE